MKRIEAPFINADADNAYDGFTPSKVQSSMEKNWEKCNHSKHYSIQARLHQGWLKVAQIFDQFDDWCEQSYLHSVFVLAVAGIACMVSIAIFAHWFLL